LQKAKESVVIVDEAYIEFCGLDKSVKALLEKYDNLIILRTFSKAFCLAGMRLGYILANPKYLEFIQRIRNSKEVSEISQVAGIAALRNWKYYEAYIGAVVEAKEYFIKEMKKKGYSIYDGHGNYVMVKVKHPHEFITSLRENKIYIRDRSYLPQLNNFVRITIGTKMQMQKVLSVVGRYED
jgi:histidinol-phosphate aminotransferase